MSQYKQGYYKLVNPEKYRGNPDKIRYMSSWELDTHAFFDNNPMVIEWASEGIIVPYIKPTDGKVHRYMVDYWVKYVDKQGNVHVELIEVKPASQTKAPKRRKGKSSVYEQLQYAVNVAKWEAAQAYATSKGWKFRILTEKSIFK